MANFMTGMMPRPAEVQPELPMGECCPVHGFEERRPMMTPVGDWKSTDRVDQYQDTVYHCDAYDRNGRCSWAWSVQIGVFVPPGLDGHRVRYGQMYHEKRYRPRKWTKRYG